MSRLIRNEEGKIIKLRLENATVSYPYLVSPRPEGQFKAGSYGAEFIIYDEETKALVKDYVKEVAKTAIATHWNNKVPQKLGLPYEEGNEEVEREAGALILKTSSPKFQPRLFIRDPQTGRAHEITEDEIDSIYAGMIADADVTFKAYNVNGSTGITAYLGAVCKVADGEPFATKQSLEDSFSLPSVFDAEPAETKPTSKPTTKTTKNKKAAEEATEEAAEANPVSLDDLLTSPAKPKKDAPITLDDLLK